MEGLQKEDIGAKNRDNIMKLQARLDSGPGATGLEHCVWLQTQVPHTKVDTTTDEDRVRVSIAMTDLPDEERRQVIVAMSQLAEHKTTPAPPGYLERELAGWLPELLCHEG